MSRQPRLTPETENETKAWVRPIVKESLSNQAYSELRTALMRGRLKPGDQLPLRPISARFGISATPMREALTRLVVERALMLDARGTVTVPQLSRDQLLEIRSIRVDLEGRCAEKAAICATREQINGLEEIHAAIAAAQREEDFLAAVDLNTQFHLELCRVADLPVTYEIVEGLWVRCGPILTHLYDSGVPEGLDPHPHVRIIAALRAKDPEEARSAMQYDIENGGQGLLDYVSS